MDKEIYNSITEYINKLKSSGLRVKKVFLYGSYALGTAKENSDIDLLIISDDLKNMDLWERLAFLGRTKVGIKKPMEILGLTEEEFTSSDCPTFIRDEVKLKGLEISTAF